MRLALYAHYDRGASVAKHVTYCLKKVGELGFKIGFISNSSLNAKDREELERKCDRIIERQNEGFDFGMWQHGIREYNLRDVHELLLINSSVIGPLTKLDQLWRKPEVEECDFWGLTDNCDLAPHLQTYFIVFRRSVLSSNCFREFWASILPFTNKMQTIRSYEVGLTLWFEQNGFTWRSIFPQEDIWRRYNHLQGLSGKLRSRLLKLKQSGPNTTLSCPEILIRAGMPFLKAALLDPANVYIAPQDAYALLEASELPREVLDDLKSNGRPGGRASAILL